jgi:DNA polymerase-3 subunit delta
MPGSTAGGKGKTNPMPRRSSGDGVPADRKLEKLAKGDLLPFYVLYGKERYFIRKAVSILKERLLPSPDTYELLYHSVYGSEASGAELADLARSVPFFDQTRLVIVWDAEKLKEKDRKEIQGYAEDPAPFTCIAFVAGEEVPKGTLFAFVKDRYPGACIGFPGMKRAECLRWLKGVAKEKGLGPHARPDVLEGLLAGGQASLESLEKQLEILALYVHDLEEDRISEPLPFGFPEISLDQAYRLTDPLLKGDVPDVLDILNRFVGQGVPPLILLSRIAWEIRKLWQLKEEMERGSVTEATLRSIRIPPFKKDMYDSLARRLSWSSLGQMFFSVGEADRLLKSSRLDPQFHLEDLCERIAQLVTVRSVSSGNRSYTNTRS